MELRPRRGRSATQPPSTPISAVKPSTPRTRAPPSSRKKPPVPATPISVPPPESGNGTQDESFGTPLPTVARQTKIRSSARKVATSSRRGKSASFVEEEAFPGKDGEASKLCVVSSVSEQTVPLEVSADHNSNLIIATPANKVSEEAEISKSRGKTRKSQSSSNKNVSRTKEDDIVDTELEHGEEDCADKPVLDEDSKSIITGKRSNKKQIEADETGLSGLQQSTGKKKKDEGEQSGRKESTKKKSSKNNGDELEKKRVEENCEIVSSMDKDHTVDTVVDLQVEFSKSSSAGKLPRSNKKQIEGDETDQSGMAKSLVKKKNEGERSGRKESTKKKSSKNDEDESNTRSFEENGGIVSTKEKGETDLNLHMDKTNKKLFEDVESDGIKDWLQTHRSAKKRDEADHSHIKESVEADHSQTKESGKKLDEGKRTGKKGSTKKGHETDLIMSKDETNRKLFEGTGSDAVVDANTEAVLDRSLHDGQCSVAFIESTKEAVDSESICLKADKRLNEDVMVLTGKVGTVSFGKKEKRAESTRKDSSKRSERKGSVKTMDNPDLSGSVRNNLPDVQKDDTIRKLFEDIESDTVVCDTGKDSIPEENAHEHGTDSAPSSEEGDQTFNGMVVDAEVCEVPTEKKEKKVESSKKSKKRKDEVDPEVSEDTLQAQQDELQQGTETENDSHIMLGKSSKKSKKKKNEANLEISQDSIEVQQNTGTAILQRSTKKEKKTARLLGTVEASQESNVKQNHDTVSKNVTKENGTGDGNYSGTDHDVSDSDDDEEMVKIFARSMKTYIKNSLGVVSTPDIIMEKSPILKDLTLGKTTRSGSMEVSGSTSSRSNDHGLKWYPDTGLAMPRTSKTLMENTKGVSRGKAVTIWKQEGNLQDGLCVPPVDPVKLNKIAKKQREDTAGAKWFDLPAATITPEMKKELQLLKLRRVIDPKRHYKADDSKGLPKYFQVGTVVSGPADFYSARLTKKEQKSTLADELLSDSSLTAYRKRKYLEIQDQKQAGGKAFWKKKKFKRTPAWAKV